MKEIQIFVPDQALRDVNDILKKAEVGGIMTLQDPRQRKFKIGRSRSGFGYNEVYT